MMRVDLLDELNDLYMLFKTVERRLVFLNVVSYASRDDQDNNEWRGRLKIITKTLESGIGQIRNEVTGIKSEMKSEMTGMKSEVTGIKSEMTGMKSEISKILMLLSKEDKK